MEVVWGCDSKDVKIGEVCQNLSPGFFTEIRCGTIASLAGKSFGGFESRFFRPGANCDELKADVAKRAGVFFKANPR